MSKIASEKILPLLECADNAGIWFEDEGRVAGTPRAMAAGRENGFVLGNLNEKSLSDVETGRRWDCWAPEDGAEKTEGLLKTGG